MSGPQKNERRDQRILILTLVGIGTAVLGLGYQMASPDPNLYIGWGVMLLGLCFVIFAVWQSSFPRGAQVVFTVVALTVFGFLVWRSISAAPKFTPRITSVIFSSSNGNVRSQFWVDVENTGTKPGFIKSWEMSCLLGDGRTFQGKSLFGQRPVDVGGMELPSDSLEDKTESTLVPINGHPKGFLFFGFMEIDKTFLSQRTTVYELRGTDSAGKKFCVRQTLGDIADGKITPENCSN